MRYYPIFLDLRGRRAVVVGGGTVAERKVRTLLRAGAQVHVISPAVTPRLAILAAKKKISLTPRAYKTGDLNEGAHGRVPLLVFATTDDADAQRAVREDAAALGALVNVADDPERSAFLVPASFRQGDLQIAISTSGTSPALARLLRRQLQRTLGPEYRAYLKVLGAARKQVMKTIPSQEQRARAYRKLASGLTDLDELVGTRRARNEFMKLMRKVGGKASGEGKQSRVKS